MNPSDVLSRRLGAGLVAVVVALAASLFVAFGLSGSAQAGALGPVNCTAWVDPTANDGADGSLRHAVSEYGNIFYAGGATLCLEPGVHELTILPADFEISFDLANSVTDLDIFTSLTIVGVSGPAPNNVPNPNPGAVVITRDQGLGPLLPFRIFDVHPNPVNDHIASSLHLAHLTVQNGYAHPGTPDLVGVCGPTATPCGGSGGGVRVINGGTLVTTNVRLRNNTAHWGGGAVANYGGVVTLDPTVVTDNDAACGGGIFNMAGSLTLDATRVHNNRAALSPLTINFCPPGLPGVTNIGYGGGIANVAVPPALGSSVKLSNGSSVDNNYALTMGGGIFNFFGTVNVDPSHVDSNTAGLHGGGIANVGFLPELSPVWWGTVSVGPQSTVNNNHANHLQLEHFFPDHPVVDLLFGHGGGVANFGGHVAFTDAECNGNQAHDNGGCLYNGDEPLEFEVDGAVAAEDAGVLDGDFGEFENGEAVFTRTDVIGNQARAIFETFGGGGGIYNESPGHSHAPGTGLGLQVLSSTVMANQSDGNGGGIFNEEDGTVHIDPTQIVGNASDEQGGGIFNEGEMSITDTNIEQNTAHGAESDSSSGNGGGIYNGAEGHIAIDHSSIYRNTADRSGGGVYNASYALFWSINNTIAENQAGTTLCAEDDNCQGGGIFSAPSTIIHTFLNHNTVVYNRAEHEGGGIWTDEGPLFGILDFADLSLNNSIVCGNFAGDGGHQILGVSQTNSRNVVQNQAGGLLDSLDLDTLGIDDIVVGGVAYFTAAQAAAQCADAGELPTAASPGPNSTWAYPPQADSPAIDIALSQETDDQWHRPRPVDVPGVGGDTLSDSGSIECQPGLCTDAAGGGAGTTGDDTGDNTGDTGDNTGDTGDNTGDTGDNTGDTGDNTGNTGGNTNTGNTGGTTTVFVPVFVPVDNSSGEAAEPQQAETTEEPVEQAIEEPVAEETAPQVEMLSLSAGLNLIGWFGVPTTSAELLTLYDQIERIWWYEAETDTWYVDSEILPARARPTIDIMRGTGFFAVVSQAIDIEVALV